MIKFEDLALEERLLNAINDLGFKNPTEIQEKSIPVLLSGQKDFIGLAQTGTGKTAAFGLPLLQLIDESAKHPQALIVCPTRELCMQIVKEMINFKKYMKGLQIVAVYGGASIVMQMKDIKKGTQIVVATPGRLIDLIERKAIHLDKIKYVVLDEADEMLNMGFQEDIEFILSNTPNRDSTWLFSATMPNEIKKVSKKYMENPVEVTVGKANTVNLSIDHQYYVTSAANRYETLKRLIDFNPGIYGLIFTRTKVDAQNITEKLIREGYDVDALHGDLTQPQRDKVMNQFRDRALQLLIATDVAARGIDVKEITHVINYELPDDIEVYTHRSGRTGRAGSTGICMSIVHSRELYKLKQIEKVSKASINKMEIPSGKDVCRKQFYFYIDRLLNADITNEEYETYVPMLKEKFAEVSKEDILKRVAALEFDRFLKYYENSEDLNIHQNDKRGKDKSSSSSRGERNKEYKNIQGETNRLFINLGTKDGFHKSNFIQFILDISDLSKDVLGRIDMRELNSWIEIDKKAAKQLIQSLDGKNFRGRKIRMNDANSAPSRRK